MFYKRIQYLISINIVILVISMPVSSSLQLNFTYDLNGNLITGDGKYREYNEFNQLVRVRQGNSSSGEILEEYIFHPMEDRILAKRVYQNGSLNETIIYPNENLVRTVSYPAANQINTSDKIYVKDESGLVAEINANQTKFFYHNDHLGSTSVVTNSSGGIVEETLYEPFGGIVSGGNKSRFYYEGKEFSHTTNDYDFHFRKYDPELMIFTQPDAGVSNVYDPQLLNRYSFERNNPYRYVDPNGKWAVQFGGSAGLDVSPFSGSFGSGIAFSYEKEQGFNFGYYSSTSQGLGFGEAGSATLDIGITREAKNIKDLRGFSKDVGGIIGYKAVIGYDRSTSLSGPSMTSHGVHIGSGIGVGGHIDRGYTVIVPISDYFYNFMDYVIANNYQINQANQINPFKSKEAEQCSIMCVAPQTSSGSGGSEIAITSNPSRNGEPIGNNCRCGVNACCQ